VSQYGALFAILSILSSVAGRNSLLNLPNRASTPDPQVTLTSSGLILEWQAPQPEVRVSAGGTAAIEMPGYAQSDWPGAPSLPVTSAWIALPPGAEPAVKVLDTVEREIDLPAPLNLAPNPEGVLRDQFGQVVGGQLAPSAHPAPFPQEVVVLEESGIVRGQRLASLHFYPLRPSGEGLRLTEYARVEVHFNAPLQPAGQDLVASDPLLAVLGRQVVNPAQMQPTYPDSISLPSGQEAPAGQETRVAIEVSQVGITAITYEALKASGFPVDSVNPQNLHLARAGQAVSYEWDGDGDNKFEPGERLLFFAEPRFSRWTRLDVYFLWEATSPGAQMSSRSAAPGSLPAGTPWTEAVFEKNVLYTPDCYCAPIPAGRNGDRWTWDSLQVPSRSSVSFSFTLPAMDPSQGATLTVWLIGYTDLAAQPDHRVEFRLNGTPVGSHQWDGKQAVEVKLNIAPTILQAGQNTLNLTLPEDRVEGMWLDAFRVRFARGGAASGKTLLFQGEATRHAYTIALDSTQNLRAYDITATNQPVQLEETKISGNSVSLGDPDDGMKHRYWLGNRVENPDRVRLAVPLRTKTLGGADYVAIAPAAFIPGLADLVQLRQGQSLQVAVENVQAIYDSFGDGRTDPAAIRAFLAQAYQTWNPRPTYVLLAGDGTSDPKLYNPTSSQTFIPPFLADVDPWAGETASDNRYATVDGDDILPDLLIGRLPANSLAELKTIVAKIVAYEAQAAPLVWSAQGLFVADNPDQAGDFPAMSEKAIHALPTPPLLSRRLYYDPQQDSEQDFRDRLHGLWNEGAGLIMYTGHASILQWAVERFLEIEAIPALKNGTRLPVLLEMTCFTGSFQVPGFQTLDESLLRQPGGGAAAAWGSTGLGLLTGQRWLAQGFIAQLYGSSQATIGEAALAGKFKLSSEGLYYDDLIDTFTLLGDPAMQIIRSDYQYLPVILQSP
jgi:Peptidase family C25/Propeptide_C25